MIEAPKLTIDYAEATNEQRLSALWDAFCDADLDLVPPEFPEDMEKAGLVEFVPVTDEALDDPFAWERGIVPGGMMWQLTPTGREALRQSGEGQTR